MLNLDSILYNRYRIDRLHELGAVETIYLGWDNQSNTGSHYQRDNGTA